MATRAPILRAITQTDALHAPVPTPRMAVSSPTLGAASWYDPRDWFGGDDKEDKKKAKQPSTPIAGDGTQGAPYNPATFNKTPPAGGRSAPRRQNLNQQLDPFGEKDIRSTIIDMLEGRAGELTDSPLSNPSPVPGSGGGGGGYGGGYSGGYGGGSSAPRIVASGPPTRTTPGGTPETYVNGRWVANYNTPKGPDFYNRPIIGPGGATNPDGTPATPIPRPGMPAPGTGQIIDSDGNIVENPTLVDPTGSVGAAPVIDWSDPSNPAIYQDGQLIADPVATKMIAAAAAADPANWLDSPIISGPAGYLETNPEVAFTRYLENQLGVLPDDNSLLAQWLRSQYDQSRAQYMAQLAADPNLLYQQFLNGFGTRNDWMNRFNALTPFQRGVNRLAFQAPTRVIADNG